jgi:hypothetical protein
LGVEGCSTFTLFGVRWPRGPQSRWEGRRVANLPNVPGAAPLLINTDAACVVVCMCPRRLWALTNCKAIPSHKIGKSVRYSPAELAAWVACGCPTEPGAAERVREGMSE